MPAKKKELPRKSFVYQGVRLGKGNALVHAFGELDDMASLADSPGVKVWAVGKNEPFVIGQCYSFPCSDEYQAQLGSAEPLPDCEPETWGDELKLWSLYDSEARSSRASKLAEARAVKKYRVAWQYGLEPLRNVYASADYHERQTLLRMVREYLEKGVA